jgi:hypothetical protein
MTAIRNEKAATGTTKNVETGATNAKKGMKRRQ